MSEKLYIVTRVHNQDYIAGTVYLALAQSENEAIIKTMVFRGAVDEDNEAELARLRSLSLDELEQDDRNDGGNVWSAEPFTMPTLNGDQDVAQIAELDTD